MLLGKTWLLYEAYTHPHILRVVFIHASGHYQFGSGLLFLYGAEALQYIFMDTGVKVYLSVSVQSSCRLLMYLETGKTTPAPGCFWNADVEVEEMDLHFVHQCEKYYSRRQYTISRDDSCDVSRLYVREKEELWASYSSLQNLSSWCIANVKRK